MTRESDSRDLEKVGQLMVDANIDLTIIAERLEALAMVMGLEPIPASPTDDPDLLLALRDGREVMCIIPKFGPNKWTVTVIDAE